MVMAIRRCPYCKAIIDGVAEYCSNCGTQLLFPEDESKEEEIPGDKIVEEEEKEEETLEAEEAESEKEEPSPEIEEEEEGKEEEGVEEEEEKEEGDEEREEDEKEEIEITTPSPREEIDMKDVEALRMRDAREMVKKETRRLWASVGTGVGGKTTPVDLEIPLPPEEKREKISEVLKKELTGEQAEEIKTEGEPLPEKEMKEETGEPSSPEAPGEEEAPESAEELQVEKEKEEIEFTPPPQREEIDLRSIRLRRTPDTEKREKEEIERFVESVKTERGKEARSSKEEIPPSAEIELEERDEKEITPPRKEEIDLQSIRMRKTPDTEEREKVEIERFVESIKRERERVKEYFTPEEEIPLPPKEMGEETSEIKERIPPWAEKIKEEPPQELEDKEEEKKIEETVELEEDLKEKEIKTPVEEPPPPTDEPLPPEGEPLPKEDKPPPTDEPLPPEDEPPKPADKPLPPADEPLPPIDKPLLSEKEIGFPEEVDQKVPFAREIREKRKRAMKRRRSGYYAWLKARAFDFVFIAAFSLICLGLASRLMEVSLFRLISASGPPVLVFYFVLLLFYFGFFILFLGETPGDRLFPRD